MTHSTEDLKHLFKAQGPVASFQNTRETVQAIQDLYKHSCEQIVKCFRGFLQGDHDERHPPQGAYPFLGIVVDEANAFLESAYSFGIVDTPGAYATTLTNPGLFGDYLQEQLDLLMDHYPGIIFHVGLSQSPIPLPFVVDLADQEISVAQSHALQKHFVFPDLVRINDDIANHTHVIKPGFPGPLNLFSGERTDYSLHRLHHYTGTDPKHFQNFILLTNYQRYMRAFQEYAVEKMRQDDQYTHLVFSGGKEMGIDQVENTFATVSAEGLPQMPTCHLKRADGNGITFINIGVGPTNAKNITDHLAVLRPHCWLMLGHCAGLQSHQMLGDYVLAHGYVRDDHVLDDDLPPWVPVPPIAEVQIALQQAISEITGMKGNALKKRLRTGTVFTTGDRNWELCSSTIYERFNQSRAIALDMESATIAANGLRYRVPYGTLLCVSDKPIHGYIKLRGTANAFYQERVQQHLRVGLRAFELILEGGVDSLHSRKLRGFDEPPFR